MKLIDGKKIAQKLEDEIKKSRCKGGLAAILVGDNPESRLYVSIKEKAAKRVGIKFEKILFPITNYLPRRVKAGELRITNLEKKIINKIKELNKRKSITGIIVQLPLPKNLNTNKIIQAIDPKKDVDGYHPENLKKFQAGEFQFFPPVLGAVLEILKDTKMDIRKKTVALVSKSDVFPIPYQAYFEKNAKNFIRCRPQELNECLLADIVITALGKKHYLKSGHIKKGAAVIDIGIVRQGKKIYGDADSESISEKVAYLTPVPGGVGPITVACLLKNTVKK